MTSQEMQIQKMATQEIENPGQELENAKLGDANTESDNPENG